MYMKHHSDLLLNKFIFETHSINMIKSAKWVLAYLSSGSKKKNSIENLIDIRVTLIFHFFELLALTPWMSAICWVKKKLWNNNHSKGKSGCWKFHFGTMFSVLYRYSNRFSLRFLETNFLGAKLVKKKQFVKHEIAILRYLVIRYSWVISCSIHIIFVDCITIIQKI